MADPMRPRPISRGEFDQSNVFLWWSYKVSRQVGVTGVGSFCASLVLEFMPEIERYCERPPLGVRLRPGDSRERALDFWVRYRSGRQHGLLILEDDLLVEAESIRDHLAQAVDRNFACKIWRQSDLLKREVYLANLRKLRPFLSANGVFDRALERSLVEVVATSQPPIRWAGLYSQLATHPKPLVDRSVVRLLFEGRLNANLADARIGPSTELTVP